MSAGRDQVARFLAVGVAGTLAYLAVYLVLREVLSAHAANVIARIGVAVPTTWVNSRHTFHSRASMTRVVLSTAVVLAVTTALTSAFLAVEQVLAGPSDRSAEVATLVVANLVATVVRFQLMRRWLFRPPAPAKTNLQPRTTGATA